MAALKQFTQKLKLDKHHKMERFGILFIVFCLLFTGIFSCSYYIQYKNSQVQLTSQALYAHKAKWSMSGKEVNIEEIYRNKDFTKAFIVFNVGSMDDLSSSASDYQVFIGSNHGKINHALTGAVYVFSDTGYIGVELNDTCGFEQILSTLILRSRVQISDSSQSSKSSSDSSKGAGDKFNQITFDVNLSGSDAVVADVLGKDDVTINDLYAECVASKQYEDTKAELAKDLTSINSDLAKAREYKRRLDNFGFENTELPVCVRNDFMTTDETLTTDNPVEFDPKMFSLNSTVISSHYAKEIQDAFDNGETDMSKFRYVTGEDPYLVTSFVFPGGCQFNYQTIGIMDHYLDKILPAGMSYREWKMLKQNEKAEYSGKTNENMKLDKTKLMFEGNDYDYKIKDEYTDTINNYERTITSLTRAKEKYQTTTIFKLLDIEASVKIIDKGTSVNASEDALVVLGQSKPKKAEQSSQSN